MTKKAKTVFGGGVQMKNDNKCAFSFLCVQSSISCM